MTHRDPRAHTPPNSTPRATGAEGPRPQPRSSRRRRDVRRRHDRRLLSEALEQRQLLAGPDLIGIQPNAGSLINGGEILNVSPRELVFRFDDNTELDPATLGGIRITRAGADGVFESATATSDLGTDGAVLVEFRAAEPGVSGNGITVNLIASPRGGSPLPIITTGNRSVTINVNNNPALPTRVQDLVTAVAQNAAAAAVLEVIPVSGSTLTPIGTTVTSGTTLILSGANAAQAETDFGTNGAVRVRIVSQLPGSDGVGTQINLERRNFGGPANPVVVASGQTILVQLNSTPGFASTAQDFINAINNNPDAGQLVQVLPQSGDLSTPIGATGIPLPNLTLTGVSDIVVEPGFVGLGDSAREVVFRFAEPLPDDLYQIDILGIGPAALRNVDGDPFQDGVTVTRQFRINLGPRVVAVVPEPLRRNAAGQLAPQVGKIEVHFNDDRLDPADATNPDFYQLIFTRDTVSNRDDVVVPLAEGGVTYNANTNIVTLDYGRPLSRIREGGTGPFLTGAARLRIGTAAELPQAPVEFSIATDPADTFDGATDIAISSDSLNSVTLRSEIKNTIPFGLDLPGPDVAGTREIRPDDPSRIDRPVPLDYLRGTADVIDGISTIQYNFANSWIGDDPNRPGILRDKTYFNIITEEQKERVREVMTLFSEYLGVSFVEAEGTPTSDAFFSIAVGDLYGGDELAVSGPGGLALVTRDRDLDGIDDLVVLDFQDFDQSIDDLFGGEFFRGAMFGVGQLLGYGYADDLPQPVTQSTGFIFTPGTDNEPAFPSPADIIHGQYLFRPDSTDIDLYRFSIDRPGTLSIESLAERLGSPSLLDTSLRLFQLQADGEYVEIAQNDDYFSQDSFVELEVSPGSYIIGVSASGNTQYDPIIESSGFGGRTEGEYELRLQFSPAESAAIRDQFGQGLDGDGDGRSGGIFNYWFEPFDPNSTIYVDKAAPANGNGTVLSPYRNLNQAIASAMPGDTIRVAANGGVDGRVETPADNFSYQIGFASNGLALQDGSSLNLPQGVNMVVDAGVIMKFSRSRVGIGSVSPLIDVSDASFQVLGTPRIITAQGQPARDALGNIIPGNAYFTSINDDSLGMGNMARTNFEPLPGDWGGIDFRGDLDSADETRRNREDEGVFLNHLQFADLRYGGGRVLIAGRQVVVSPVDMAITRATVINSRITDSADAAIAATPDTFTETRFSTPDFQSAQPFTPDYTRVGPSIFGNTVVDNSINGLFIRVVTRTGDVLQPVTETTRFDDVDITHVLTENLVIQGTPGGAIVQSSAPSSLLVRLTPTDSGNVPAGSYVYRLTNVDALGLETVSSQNTVPVTLNSVGGVILNQLPPTGVQDSFVSRRLYRAPWDPVAKVAGEFRLVAQLNASSTSFVDRVAAGSVPLDTRPAVLRSRTDASVKIDPGTVLKIDGARIEARFGAGLIAEGSPSLPIVFTSLEDQRYGVGGTFDTNDRGNADPLDAGDWGGIYIGPGGSASLDRTVIAGGGGTTRIEGGFASFNVIEVHQGSLRLANSRLEQNADGRGLPSGERAGRGDNSAATVFVRAAQPVLTGNTFIDGESAAISFDINSLSGREVSDPGRASGRLDRNETVGNYGPLVEDNVLANNTINGMRVRGGEIVTSGVWDDVDIVHVVTDSIEIPNRHVRGGLRLQSDARGSLVVKFQSDPDEVAGIVVGGTLLSGSDQLRDIPDRIGGALQIVGHPDFPVVLTTLADDSAGAGFTIDGIQGVDTNNDGIAGADLAGQAGALPTGPEVNNGTLIDNDVDPEIVGHFEANPGPGNSIGFVTDGFTGSGVTVRDLATAETLVSQNYIFAYQTYVTTADGIVSLDQTTITQEPTLIADDVVESRGTFPGANGPVAWIATSSFIDGVARLDTRLELDGAANPLGNIRVVSYLDEDVEGISDDILVTTGTPGQSDFRVFTLDGPRRVGFSHGGFYVEDGQNLVNATYDGWAADQFPQLQEQIVDNTQTYSIEGEIDLADLPPAADVDFGTRFGPADVTTALAWTTADTATSATITSFLELLAADPALQPIAPVFEPGLWEGIVVREGADDRNVAAITESEPVRGAFVDLNAIPGQSQFLGEIAPNLQSGDENRRLGFIVNGAITRRDDLDVYSFIAESGTEVWLDIDQTGNQLDSVVELIDANGRVLAASNDSILAESDPAALFTDASTGLDPDAALPLTVVEERLPVQRLTFGDSIQSVSSGNIVYSIQGSDTLAELDIETFLNDPAGSTSAILQSTFPELGEITGLLLRSTDNSIVVELRFDPESFIGRSVPRVSIDTSELIGPTVPASSEAVVLDSQLQDEFTSNRKDAGMRIRLPGESGTRNQYHVRVRSSNTRDPLDFQTLADPSRVRDGLSKGSYQFQIRLRETDEHAGTQLNFADVRYANNGLHIIGQPLHSPLLGEEYDVEPLGDLGLNDTLLTAQPLGYLGAIDVGEANILQSDRLAKSVAGTLASAADVDFYRFEVRYEDLTRGVNDPPLHLATIFDLDYAGGFARADMALYVFNEAGSLIYVGGDSNIADDLPTTINDNNTEDLSRGSAAGEDPYIGVAELVEGVYYVAVANQQRVAPQMDQFFNADSTNPLLRLEPIDSITRIAEERFDLVASGTASLAQVPVLFDEESIIEYALDDVLIYVNTGFELLLANPFTGQTYGTVGNFDDEIEEVAFRSNGELFSYSGFFDRQRDDNNWFYYRIDTGDASLSDPLGLAGAGIDTFSASPNEEGEVTIAAGNVGLDVEAMAIGYLLASESGYFVANRPLDIGSQQGGASYGTNILYEFIPENGNAFGDPIGFTNRLRGAATSPQEIGQLDTEPSGQVPTHLGIQAATVIDGSGQQVPGLVDGDTFTITDGSTSQTFEFDSGPTLTALGENPVLDGTSIIVGNSLFEFNTGTRLQLEQGQPSGNLTAGTRIRLEADGTEATFEFVRTLAARPNNIAIDLLNASGQPLPAATVAASLAAAINANVPSVGAEPVGDLVVFSGTNPPQIEIQGSGVAQLGDGGLVNSGAVEILVSETADPTVIVQRLQAAIRAAGIPAIAAGTQISFPTLADDDLMLMPALDGVNLVGAIEITGFVGSDGITIPLFPGDSERLIAERVSRAINGAFPASSSLTAQSAGLDGTTVRLIGGEIASVDSANDALVAGGVPTGGLVRGVELINDQLYAVSDTGGLFRVSTAELQTAGDRQVGTYVAESTDLIGINFSGLRAGPVSYDDGSLRETLFGITSSGDIYAFNTSGELQPVFSGGRSMISTGIGGARGFDFSTLGFNLWHVTSQRGDDPGHGINPLEHQARLGSSGGNSLAFTFEASAFNSNYPFSDRPVVLNNDGTVANPRQDETSVEDRYNMPGGAKGVVESNPFSLEGYSAADEPTLYFNYFLETDSVDSATADQDAFRVYVIAPDGAQHLVASNNTARGEIDEFDDPPAIGQYDDNIDVETQQTFDNTGTWRQARVPLGPFAGQNNLRLRIEFSTAGTTSTGSLSLRTTPGSQLNEDDQFVVGGETFTIDLAPVIGVPSGLQLQLLYEDPDALAVITVDGQEYVLNDGTRQIGAGQIAVDLFDNQPSGTVLGELSASDIAASLTETIRIAPPANIIVDGLQFLDQSDVDPTNDQGGRNDRTFEAFDLPYNGGNVTFIGTGQIGNDAIEGDFGEITNTLLIDAENTDDVDLLRVTVERGTTVAVNLRQLAGTTLSGAIRFFDSEGNALPSAAESENSATLVAGESGTIFIGISGRPNMSYNPLFDDNLMGGDFGGYEATIEINPLLTVRDSAGSVEILGADMASAQPAGLFSISGVSEAAGIPIAVSRFMSAEEVAQVVQRAFANRFVAGNTDAFPTRRSSILVSTLSIDDPGPFVDESERYGDQFGAGVVAGARDNDFEGVYVDDIIIGFAERGETATGGNPITSEFLIDGRPSFTDPPDPVSDLVTGSYQLEIRDASEYVDSLQGVQFRTFDTNDRLTESYTITARPASELRHGSIFTISDGRATVNFEFNLTELAQDVTPGNVEIPFTLSVVDPVTGRTRPQTAAEVAANIVAAINRSDVQAVIDVPAVRADGIPELVASGNADAVRGSTSGKINLFAEIVVEDFADSLAAIEITNRRGDDNREREGQGVILVENSRFLRNAEWGVAISHGTSATVAGQTTASVVRYPRNLVELNSEQIKPGVVVRSSVMAFNDLGGLQINGFGLAETETGGDPVAFDRIVNNTIIGGEISIGVSAPPEEFGGRVFPAGRISFADSVISYIPDAGNAPPASIHQSVGAVLGPPTSLGQGSEPIDGEEAVSLGRGGSITVAFVDNVLTGSGDNQPDLIVYETGEIESVRVEISRDGQTFFDVGIVGGLSNTVDIDQFGFGPRDRFAIVRLTDLRQGSVDLSSLGADIDAVGAISSTAVERFTAAGTGIQVNGDTAPALLNNVIANSTLGLQLETARNQPILGGNTFYRNAANSTPGSPLGEFVQQVPDSEVLFFGASGLVFVPAAGASIIDSSIDSVLDRASLTTVKGPLGIPPSPIIAPRLDVNGQLRVDDPNVEPPSGLGERVFKDRGASDRGDLIGPRMVMLSPQAPGLGLSAGLVSVLGQAPQAFEIQLIDGLAPADIVPGTGIDDRTVSSDSLLLFRNGQLQVEGTDYRFGYNPSTNVIRLTPIAGVWEQDSTYVIRVVDAQDAIIQAIDGDEYADGSALRIADASGQVTRFEYETGITLAPTSGSLDVVNADGLVISVFDGESTISFEFDNDQAFGPLNVPVTIPESGPLSVVVQALADAVNASTLNLTAVATEDSVQFLGSNPLSSVSSESTLVSTTGSIGTSIGFGLQIPNDGTGAPEPLEDAQTFAIRRGSASEVIFELDNNGILENEDAIPVTFSLGDNLDDLANEIVRAVGGAGLGLSPTNAGFGRVFLGGDASYALDVTGSTLIPLASPGQGPTVPIVIRADLTAEETAQGIADQIDRQQLTGVTSSVFGSRIFLEGSSGITGVGAIDAPTIADEVGNRVQSNQADGRTELSIFIGGGFDYGDAPYASTSGADAARHGVDTDFALAPLGSSMPVSPDAEPRLIDGDDDNGIVFLSAFEPGFDTNLQINVLNDTGRTFYVDAWFDWDQDGLFEASEQQRYGSAGTGRIVLGNGANVVSVAVPGSAKSGETYARFRLSEVANLGPGGEAASGEVEDYRIVVGNNPFQSPTLITDGFGNPIVDPAGNNVGRADVNNSGFVSALDALQIINVLRRNGADQINLAELPLPSDLPVYPDPNGDGVVSAADALYVINRLAILENPGEGEASLLAGAAAPAPYVSVGSGILASAATVAGDAWLAATGEPAEVEPVEPALAPTAPPVAKISVFDSAATVQLDGIVEALAEDHKETKPESAASPVDSVFAQL